MRRLAVALVLVALVVYVGLTHPSWSGWASPSSSGRLRVAGNVDLRVLQLSFQNAQRIASVLVEEGDRVAEGQVVARLDSSRLVAAAESARARRDAQAQVLARLQAGTRPEEIAAARANVAAAEAELARARRTHERVRTLVETHATAQQDLDNALAALDVATAQLGARRAALDLAVAGPRAEEIGEARAAVAAAEAELAYRERELADAELRSPVAGVVRARLLHPGELASPERPVVAIAVSSPKWARVYVHEPELPRVRPGLQARVTADGLVGSVEGWVGFVSPVAEFTPRTVETEELRTSLVYEVRVFVKDPADALRLGSPVTVEIDEATDAARGQ